MVVDRLHSQDDGGSATTWEYWGVHLRWRGGQHLASWLHLIHEATVVLAGVGGSHPSNRNRLPPVLFAGCDPGGSDVGGCGLH